MDICFCHVCNADEVLPPVLHAGRVGRIALAEIRNTTLWGLLDLCALIFVISTGVATYSASLICAGASLQLPLGFYSPIQLLLDWPKEETRQVASYTIPP